jgi:hypothetical protein
VRNFLDDNNKFADMIERYNENKQPIFRDLGDEILRSPLRDKEVNITLS